MELNERLERIEQLKTDKYMQLLLLGLRCVGSIEKIGEELLSKHGSKKNQTINLKIGQFKEELVDEYWRFAEPFDKQVHKEILAFIGEDEGIDSLHDLLFGYSTGDLTLDELIAELKQDAIDFDNIPEGHVAMKIDGKVRYMTIGDYDKLFPEDD